MTTYAQVIPLTKLPKQRNQAFTYRVPPDLVARVNIGHIVEVGFGSRQIKAMVIKLDSANDSLKPFSPDPARKNMLIKDIVRIYDQKSLITPEQYKLAIWLSDYYISSLSLTVKLFAPRWYEGKKRPESYSIPASRQKSKKSRRASDQPVTFSLAQEGVWSVLKTSLGKKIPTTKQASAPDRPFLLHGVTGSGKTEIYSRVIEEILGQGKQALFMLPEIALTTQFISHFQTRFSPDLLAVLHSKMSPKERVLEMQRIASGEACIIIGPRSALFAPFKKLGVIIVDEEHDSSYKQYDQSPRYHVRETAQELARIWDCILILGSATPSLEAYHRTKIGVYQLLELPDRFSREAVPKQLPEVLLVDMREEIKKGNKSVLSDELHDRLEQTLENNGQALLFLNRRGMSTIVLCRDCGFVLDCPRCEIPFVFHVGNTVATQALFCHHCSTRKIVPTRCPKCQSSYFKFLGTGTERVEMEIREAFPRARILRMDADTTRARGSHERIMTAFRSHKADILIGTQMITKGFDLPNVDLVGIISVDNLLNMPDFRASEMVFQLVTQVAGRAGRRTKRGICIVQTYAPANPIFKFATSHDYSSFYEKEIKDRDALLYPPFSRLIKLVYAHKDNEKAQSHAISLKRQIDRLLGKEFDGEVLGPSPSFVPKKNNRYYWHLIIKHQGEAAVAQLLREIPDDWTIDIDPFTLL